MITYFYDLLNRVLPFSFLHHGFMKNAFLVVIFITPALALLGTMIVNGKMAFFAESLGHSAFTGIAIGSLAGIYSKDLVSIIFAALFSFAVIYIKKKGWHSNDTIISVFSSGIVSLGIVIISLVEGTSKYASYFVGDLLSVKNDEVILIFYIFILVVLFFTLIFKKILVSNIDASLARSRGINTFLYEYLFTAFVAIVVTLTIKFVGLLIINALLVMPAASAKNICRNIESYVIVTVFISFIAGIIGLICSYYYNTAAGATIVLVNIIIFMITLFSRIYSKNLRHGR